MEILDVLTPEGLAAGFAEPKADVHRDGDWCRTAHVWLVTPTGASCYSERVKDMGVGGL